jgi:glycosyltransferase involved in cell wall biosynthesis
MLKNEESMLVSNHKPIITAIIPTYRRPKLLRRAVLSVLNQTYPHVRACVYDNASEDETEEVVTELRQKDNRVRYHSHPQNIGSYNNFNYGICEVDTQFFSLLSDDDIFAPEFFEKAIKTLHKYPKAMFVCMPTIAVDLDLNVVSGPVSVAEEKTYEPGEGLAGMVDGSIPAKWSGILFRKEVRDGIGVIDTEAGPYADAGYVFHAAARFPFVVVPGIAAVYVIHENTTSGTVKPLDGTWPGWWDHMVAAIADDPLVPMFARKNTSNIIYPDFRKMAVYQTLRSLGEGNPKLAKQSADGVRECGHSWTSQLLNMLVWTYCHSGTIRYIFARIKQRRKTATKKSISELHAKFSHAVEFVKTMEQSYSENL